MRDSNTQRGNDERIMFKCEIEFCAADSQQRCMDFKCSETLSWARNCFTLLQICKWQDEVLTGKWPNKCLCNWKIGPKGWMIVINVLGYANGLMELRQPRKKPDPRKTWPRQIVCEASKDLTESTLANYFSAANLFHAIDKHNNFRGWGSEVFWI